MTVIVQAKRINDAIWQAKEEARRAGVRVIRVEHAECWGRNPRALTPWSVELTVSHAGE